IPIVEVIHSDNTITENIVTADKNEIPIVEVIHSDNTITENIVTADKNEISIVEVIHSDNTVTENIVTADKNEISIVEVIHSERTITDPIVTVDKIAIPTVEVTDSDRTITENIVTADAIPTVEVTHSDNTITENIVTADKVAIPNVEVIHSDNTVTENIVTADKNEIPIVEVTHSDNTITEPIVTADAIPTIEVTHSDTIAQTNTDVNKASNSELNITAIPNSEEKETTITSSNVTDNIASPTVERTIASTPVIEHSTVTPDANVTDPVLYTTPHVDAIAKSVIPGAFTVDSNGKVSVDYLYDGGYYQGDLAIFSLKGMEHLQPGSEAFIQEAAHRALSNSELGHVVIFDALEGARFDGKLGEQSWNAGTYQGAKTVSMTPGDEFAVMLVPHGKVQEVFDNPKIGGAKSPLFSISTSNEKFAQMVDVTGKGHTFAFEDLRVDGKSDRDYNDIIFQVKGANTTVQHFEDAIAPGKDWRNTVLGKELLAFAANADIKLEIAHPVSDITLTPTQPTNTVDLSQVFSHPNPDKLHYEIIAGNSASLQVQLDGNQLHLTGLPKTGVTDVAIRAFDDAGNVVTHSFAVTTSTLSQESTQAANAALSQLTDALAQNSQDLADGLDSEAGEIALSQLELLIQQDPDVLRLLNKPETLSQLGISNAGVNTLKQLLSSKEIAEEFGLPVTLGEALSNPDKTLLDSYLINADEAVDLLSSNAKQPKVGFLDFSGEHTQRVTESFASINPLAKFNTLPVSNGNWAEQLVKFVDKVHLSGENHGIVNLSFDLSQIDDIGLTTRYELTPAEQNAIAYAREHNILLVVAAGNTGDKMSALGAAAEQFDNIITVGAVNQLEERADYSAMGNGLSIVAPGGEWDDDPNAFVGTSRATPYVTAAASLIWAANSGLSYQQVKELLLATAADLNTPGWDAQTGAGLLDVKEAVRRAQLIEPQKPGFSEKPGFWEPFSGEGRAKTLERAASDGTEKAIKSLENTQESLLEEWQVLADLGNPDLTLSDLQTQVGDKIAEAFKKYQEVSTQAGITTAQAQQWVEALALATQHYQIEETRLQALETRKKELEAQLAQFGEQKTALEKETQTLLDSIKEQITLAESDLAKAKEKLTNPFGDADDNLQFNPDAVRQAALQQQQMAQQFQQQALGFDVERQRYQNAAAGINAQRWQVVGSQRGTSGRTTQTWGWAIDPNQQKRKDTYNWQAGISAQNSQSMTQLSQQAQQQSNLLNQYADFLEGRQNNLDLGAGSVEDGTKVLQLLQEQAAEQQKIANQYFQQAAVAEQRRQANQDTANWHNSLTNRWEQVGTRRSGKRTEPVYGTVHYPEHIAPANQAQYLANVAAGERNNYQQLAQQAQQQATALQQQVEKLQTRLRDWPVLKQGIDYEIDADALRLQAEKDLLALHTPVQQQKLETLNLQISQAQEELQKLENQKIPTQQQATDLTENRLKETQTEVEAIQTQRAKAQKDLQNFLETAGFLLPYRERLTSVQKSIQQLSDEKLDVQLKMQQLSSQLTKTPSDSLRQQLNYWNDHLATINQELDWAKLQQDQLAQAIADSPERLAISGLIKELETAPASINPTSKIEKLKLMEGSGANFLEGFDNLAQRLADAKAEENQTQNDLDKLNREYRELGLQKANLEDNLIPGKQKEIAAKEKQIAGTESAIAQTQASLNSLQNQLTQTQDSLAQKSGEIQQQEGVIAATQSQVTNLQNQISANTSDIQQQQSVVQGYQNQINQANNNVNSLEQQLQQHQANANYWNSQVNTWGVVGWQDQGYWGGKRGRQWISNWQPVYGWVYNPQAEANRNAEQAAANNSAWQRDLANQQAQQLSATLQPKIAATQQQIATLQQQQQSLNQQQQALNSQLANQQTQLQQLQQELQAITQQVNNLQSQINQTQNQLNGLNTQLGNQQQQREGLIAELAQLNQQKSDLEQKLIEKYREIELTDKYFDQVNAEVERLQSRLDLLNKAGVLEQKYQQNWQSWQQTTQEQAIATQALLDVRKAGQPDRDRLLSLQQQLKDTQGNLDRAKSIQKSITDTQQALEFTKLQLGNQNLLLQSLIDNDDSLAALERYYLNDAATHQQRIWQWNGSSYAYNAAEADAYRASLQQGSFVADMRNRLWKQRQDTLAKINELNQKISQQTSDIAKKQSELAGLGQTIPQIESQIITIQGEITTVNKRLEPLQVQENKQTQIIQTATTQAQNLAAELSQTTQLHSTALRQLIGFGILASESDVDFFATQVEPQVNTHLEQLKTVGNDLGNQINSQNQQIANWQQELANTQDDVSKQVLTNLIEKAKTQLGNLETLKASNQSNANELKELLKQATEALTPLRQKQELEIRQKLESNDGRIEALQSQLNSENAADAAIKSGTVLDHVQLADQINQDLRLGVTNWTEQLLAGNQQTKALVTQQQDLSKSVDELITYINDQLAEPDGNYNRIHADLEDGITTLGVVENRADELDTAFTSTEDAIARIKLRIEQDAKLWEEIAPIAIRYGVESQELKDYLKTPGDEKTRRAAFLAKYPDNGTAIDLLKGETLEGKNPTQEISNLLNNPYADVLLNAEAVEGRNPNQALFDKAKSEQASHEAQGYAALAQAAWYEQQAAYNWNVSRKNGPYWYEERCAGKRRHRQCWMEQHVDYNWIAWQDYSQIFPQLRAQGYAHLVEADKWRKEKERIEPLKNQWIAANDAANQAEPPIDEARNFYAELEAARQSIPGDKVQLASLENLLPIIQQQLEQAEAEAAAQNAKVRQEWQEYDTDSEEYRAAIADILQRRGELNTKAIETQQQLADAEQNVERQMVGLSTELESTKVLNTSLEQQRRSLQNQIINLQNQGVTGGALDDLNTNLVQVDRSLQLLNNKAAILTAEQTALTQKRTMLTAQNEVILAEQRLLDAYIQDPDADYSNLQQQLNDARAALAEAQRLAEQAEAASQALTAPLQQLKTDLLAQNDEHLKAAKEHQQILKALVEATQSNANYTLQAAQKQQEVNNLEFQIIQRLQQATAAGNQEAKALLNVAQRNDMATAAEMYYRDYSDLASDRGGCAGGAGNAQDQMLANQYYGEMLNNRELQRRAQAQADAFRQAKETAEAQMKTLQSQQEIAAQLLSDLNAKVAETQAEREKKTQELAIAQASLDGITRIREQTEQTFIQLVTLEKLNLAQAQLEQEIAQNRQANIDEAVKERQERDRLELDRQRKETTAKIEQLKQLQAEDNLRQNLNQARGQLGLATLDPTEDPMQLQTQLAGLLTSLKDLETQQPDLPDDVKALLAEARGDIHEALQGKEATTIQDNLLKAMGGLIGQIDQYKTEINRIDLEEQWDNQLLQTAQSDLQGASQQFLEELQKSEQLSGEKQIIDPLYQEALIKIAYAEQAVEMSNDLAEQGKKMLDEIIKQRVAERKARKKAFWNKILGIVSTVFSLLGAVLTFVPGANLIGLALGAIGGAINVVQAAINGDWMGAIFSAVMAGANFVGGAIGNALKAGQSMVMGMTQAVAQKVFSTIKAFQSLASGAFNGVRNLLSGDKIMGFLQIMGGLAGAATSGISGFVQGGLSGLSDIGKFGYKVLESLSKAPTLIYGGIKAIQSGDWVGGIGNIIKGVVSLGKTWTNDFNDGVESPGEKIANILENVSSVGIGVSKFITGGLEGVLEGLGDILDGLGDDIQKWVDNLVAGGECDCPCQCPEEELADSAEIIVDEIIELDSSPAEVAERLEGLDPALQAEVIDYLPIEDQISVIGKFSPEQQAELVPNLSQETKKELAYRYLEKYQELKQEFENTKLPNISTVSAAIDGVTYPSSSESHPLTQREAFWLIVQKSLPYLPGEIGQRLTDPAFLAAMTTAAKDGALFAGGIALAQCIPIVNGVVDVALAVSAPFGLAYMAYNLEQNKITTLIEASKAIQHAWWAADQLAKDSSEGNISSSEIESNINSAGKILANEGANSLEPTIHAYGITIAGLVSGAVVYGGVNTGVNLLKNSPKALEIPELYVQVPIPKSPSRGYSGGLTSQELLLSNKLFDWTVGTPAKNLINNGTKFSGKKLPTNGPPNGVLYKANGNQITNYAVYNKNGLIIKRVDLVGRDHNGVSPPHVVGYKYNISENNRSPMSGKLFSSEEKLAIKARPEEIP
ncbi:S8 family serine peptidase, partial [Argonema galeatum]|uniref:S8 family serine peptidase n=1 Tax=Argonema galeatum TaxID=2942762 RepID=UPI0020118F1A